MMNKIFFLCRTAIPWRELPECCGPYTTCYDRCRKNGDWLEILARLQSIMDMNDDPDRGGANALQTRLIDPSAVRAHRYAAGSHPDGGSLQLGRSQGGMNAGIHASVDGNGQPTALFLSPGQAVDCTAAETLLADIKAGMTVIADTAYDTNSILDHLADVEATAVIPPRSHRAEPRTLDTAVYATRNWVERFFRRIEAFRRVAIRRDAGAREFLSALIPAATHRLMRSLARATICVHGLNRPQKISSQQGCVSNARTIAWS